MKLGFRGFGVQPNIGENNSKINNNAKSEQNKGVQSKVSNTTEGNNKGIFQRTMHWGVDGKRLGLGGNISAIGRSISKAFSNIFGKSKDGKSAVQVSDTEHKSKFREVRESLISSNSKKSTSDYQTLNINSDGSRAGDDDDVYFQLIDPNDIYADASSEPIPQYYDDASSEIIYQNVNRNGQNSSDVRESIDYSSEDTYLELLSDSPNSEEPIYESIDEVYSKGRNESIYYSITNSPEEEDPYLKPISDSTNNEEPIYESIDELYSKGSNESTYYSIANSPESEDEYVDMDKEGTYSMVEDEPIYENINSLHESIKEGDKNTTVEEGLYLPMDRGRSSKT